MPGSATRSEAGITTAYVRVREGPGAILIVVVGATAEVCRRMEATLQELSGAEVTVISSPTATMAEA